ncbi:YjbH domain-containing protein [Burkholderia sp. Ac-20353]|uniref:YjbH domain-containing protein n=1 Tax=Burkholderia sp. Ac-20353 TaxID=2703894 RepID=UPI00197BA9FB|nr:YjbH domain-containing protein [Burkholderia sp. Ac-20353]MBN3786233.1 YjbH domain-containing protein [Burkholderia sp. Ac-20353]
MTNKLRAQRITNRPTAAALGAALAFSLSAQAAHAADSRALTSLGLTGGLVIPYGFVLPEGTFEGQYNNYIDPRFGKKTTRSDIVWGAVGLFPYVEVSGGLVNYPGHNPVTVPGYDHLVLRHLMANLKVAVPKFFAYQPDMALGISDIGGQTHYFRSTYGVVSQSLGPATFTVGYGKGDRLDGVFGGAELQVWHTGLSLLAEHDSKTPYAGIRYRSPPIRWLADASIVGTLVRALKDTNGVVARTSFSIGVQIPLGKRFDAARCGDGLCQGPMAAAGNTAENTAGNTTANTTSAYGLRADSDVAPVPLSAAAPFGSFVRVTPGVDSPASVAAEYDHVDALPLRSPLYLKTAAPAKSAMPDTATPDAAMPDAAKLDEIVRILTDAGLERVRAGAVGADLVVEYENHRYNQNEADALGIALGAAAEYAPSGVDTIRVVIKKANEPLGEVSIERAAYARFVEGGAPTEAGALLTMRTRPTHDAGTIAWTGNAHKHGLVRIQIAPVTSYLYGTEYGNFDYSVGANIQGFVPLWRGAELYSSVIVPLANSRNMDNGRVYDSYRLRGGLSTVALVQSFWIAPRVFNVTALGKFNLQYLGVENETTAFVPGRPDVVRLKLAYLRHEPGKDALPDQKNALLTYRWVQPSWKMWIEAGVARYVGGDKGPLITLTRWFDDVSFSLQGWHSGRGSFAGVTVSFPLTPRQGMKPGIVQINGPEQFSLNFRTRVGSSNYLAQDGAENLVFGYNTQQFLLNQGRFSAEYFATQLYRMRDAYKRYAHPARAAAPAADAAQLPADAARLQAAHETQ